MLRSFFLFGLLNLFDGVEWCVFQFLVVDDDVMQCSLIMVVVRQVGYEVSVVLFVVDVIEKLCGVCFDCVMFDFVLEDGDGIDVLCEMVVVKFGGVVIVISGMDGKCCSVVCSFVCLVGIELQSLLKLFDFVVLCISFVNFGKMVMGFFVMYIWGGVVVDVIVEWYCVQFGRL